jgi:hypothetical protein
MVGCSARGSRPRRGRWFRRLTVVAVATAAWLALRDERWCACRKAAARRATRLLGRGRGIAYRFAGGHPALDVDDATLADRVRSSLGPLEKRLDVPRVHVMVEKHTVLLHGEVASSNDAEQIEMAALAVAGVEGVESYLHVGLVASDTRPSEGHRSRPAPG